MKPNVIGLEFDKAATRLAGYPYGRSVFNVQVKDKLNYNVLNIIVIPDNIVKIASSFTQGFFADIIKEIGYQGIHDKTCIQTVHEELRKNMKRQSGLMENCWPAPCRENNSRLLPGGLLTMRRQLIKLGIWRCRASILRKFRQCEEVY